MRGVLACVVALLAATACTSPATTEHEAPPTVAQAAPGQARAAAAEVCRRFTTVALGVDATRDLSPAEARQRAAHRYGTPALAEQLAGHGHDPTWALLVRHDAHIEVRTEPVSDDPPPVRGDSVGAAVTATRTALGPRGWTQRLPEVVVYCSLVRTSDTWRVTAVTVSDTTMGAQQ